MQTFNCLERSKAVGGISVFGYIRPFEPQLRVCELELYKSAYCGLCRSLSKSYGPVARFVLSYDFTFTTLLHIGLSGKSCELEKKRCPYKLTAQPHLCECSELRFSTAVAAIMIYHKLCDDIADSGPVKSGLSRLALPPLSVARKKAAAAYPQVDNVIATAMERQRTVESLEQVSLDAASEPTSWALGELFAMMTESETDRRIMHRFGYMIGRFVYCCDAVADIESDKKTGSFNPLVRMGCDTESMRASLNLTHAEALSAYGLLNLSSLGGLLDNIVTLGLKHTIDTVLKGVTTDEQPL